MSKTAILKKTAIIVLTAGIFSCTSLGLSGKRVEISPFADVKPPYIFMVKSIRIINKDGFSTGEDFIDDFLISSGYKYNFRFIFPETALPKAEPQEAAFPEKTGQTGKEAENMTEQTSAKDIAPYILDLFIKEKNFAEDLKELTAISCVLHIYGIRNNDPKNNVLLYQVVLTEKSAVSINSYHKLYQVIDEIFNKLHKNLEQKQRERKKKKKG